MDVSLRGIVLWIIDAILLYVFWTTMDKIKELFMGTLIGMELIIGLIGFLILIIAVFLTVYLIVLAYRYFSIKMIDGIQAHIFFPKGTVRENQTLKYHDTLPFRRKLIVNLKVNPSKAYYLPASQDSYGWKLIKKFPSLWIVELESNTERSDFTGKWCEKKGFTLIPHGASKEDLLEED